jgi:hypothetical protein
VLEPTLDGKGFVVQNNGTTRCRSEEESGISEVMSQQANSAPWFAASFLVSDPVCREIEGWPSMLEGRASVPNAESAWDE